MKLLDKLFPFLLCLSAFRDVPYKTHVDTLTFIIGKGVGDLNGDLGAVLPDDGDFIQAGQDLAAGAFRDDLYYRLNVVKIHLPALREHVEDIPLLVDHFIRTYSDKNHKPIRGITRQAMNMLERYHWPGNVRELENAVERADALARTDVIGADDLPDPVRTLPEKPNDLVIPIGTPMRDVQKRIIEETLKFTDGDKSAAAGLLGIAPRTITRRLSDKDDDA